MATTLAVAMVVGLISFALACSLGSDVRTGRLLTWTMIVLGLLFGICMLLVTVRLTEKIFSDQLIAPMRAAAAPVAGGPSVAQSGQDDGGASLVANAMTAIGVTVAVVTLIISLGTSWFGERLRRIGELEARLVEATAKAKSQHRLQQFQLRVSDALIHAKGSLRDWFRINDSRDLDSTVHVWSLLLEGLSSADRDLRFKVFGELLDLDRRKPRERELDDVLKPVQHYSQLCHELALMRLEVSESESPGMRKILEIQDEGLWCRIFDRAERERYYAFLC